MLVPWNKMSTTERLGLVAYPLETGVPEAVVVKYALRKLRDEIEEADRLRKLFDPRTVDVKDLNDKLLEGPLPKVDSDKLLKSLSEEERKALMDYLRQK